VTVGETGIDDRVRFDVLADGPSEQESAYLFGSRFALGHETKFGLGNAEAIRILNKETTRDLLEDARGLGGGDPDKSKILLRGEAFDGLWCERGCDDGFDKELGDLFRCGGVNLAVDADDASEG